MHTETWGVEGDGRQNMPGSVALARSVALAQFNYLLLRACDWTALLQI